MDQDQVLFDLAHGPFLSIGGGQDRPGSTRGAMPLSSAVHAARQGRWPRDPGARAAGPVPGRPPAGARPALGRARP